MNNKTALSTALSTALLAFGLSACSVDAPTTDDFDYSFLEAIPQDDFSGELSAAPVHDPADAALNVRFRDSDHGIDAEFEKISSVYLSIDTVEVQRIGSHGLSTWESVRKEPILVDLMTLADGDVERLGAGPLPAGEYTGIRLVLGKRWVDLEDDTEQDLDLPGNVLVLGGHFDLDTDETRTMVIDFAGLRSLDVEGDTWSMDPTPSAHFVHTSQG